MNERAILTRLFVATCLVLVLSSAVRAQLNIEVIYCEIPTDPRSTVPGAQDAGGNPVVTKFKALEDFRVSHDGDAWILKGRSQLGSELEACLLIGSGLTGDMFAQEGQPFQGGIAGELYDFFDGTANPASFDTAGNIGFSARAKGGSSAIDEKVALYNATSEVHTVVLKEGDPAKGLIDYPPNPSGDEIFGNSIASVYLRDDGAVGFVNTPIGNCSSFRYPAFFVGGSSFRQSGVSTIDGFTWDSFDYDDCGGTPDGLHWYAKGDIEGVPDTSNRILAVDDVIELREGSTLPGSTMIMDDIHHTKMVSNGDWFSRGDDAADDDWAVYNGTLVAETGDEIGTSGEHLGNSFLAFGGNRVGDWVLVANTDDPDTSRDTVVLLNGQVVIREGDPIDLDSNGAFDDDVFIGRGGNTLSAFAANDIFLGDDRVLFFIAPLRNATGDDLGSDPPFGTGGDAFLRVYLSPDSCNAEAVRSYKDHSGTELYVNLGVSGGIEPRVGQVTKLEIDLDSAASVSVNDTATVNCSAAWTGTATVTAVIGNTVTVEFSPSLPDQAYCVMTLDCGAEVCVRMCEGDMNRSGATNTTDASAVKARFGATLTDANCEWDFNCSGAINTTDFSACKARFGKSAPACPQARIGDYSNSGCLPVRGDASRDDPYPCPDDDQIQLTVEGNTLHVLHRNATYNCCPDDIVISLSVEGSVLHLTEEEILTIPCDCMCCYDVEATVVDLAPGEYTVEFCWDDYETGGQRCYVEDIVIP